MDKCSECKEGSLSSFFEGKLGVCADCCARLVDMARKLSGEAVEMAQILVKAREFQETVEKISENEAAGYAASSKGFGSDQNPFELPMDRAVWDSGWARGELERKTAQSIAVMEWSVLNLIQISELAKGLGALEIASKLDTIIEKIAPFVVPG